MADSKHRRMRAKRSGKLIRAGARTAEISSEFLDHDPGPGTVKPTERELRDALGSIPGEMDWGWARPRLTPVFERPDAAGPPGDPLLHALTEMGVAVAFGIEVGPMFVPVTASLAERWESSVEQIEAAAFEHLRAVVATISPKAVQHAVHRGHLLRALPEPAGWASSVILAGADEVARIFGPHDQYFTAPSRNALVSFGIGTPPEIISEVTLALEEADLHPLQLDPFALRDGRLSWAGLTDDESAFADP